MKCHGTIQSDPKMTQLDLPIPEGRKAELTLVLVIYQNDNHLIVSRPGIEPTTIRSKARHSTVYIPSSQGELVFIKRI